MNNDYLAQQNLSKGIGGYSDCGLQAQAGTPRQVGVNSNLQALVETANETYQFAAALHSVFGLSEREKDTGSPTPTNLNSTLASLQQMLTWANSKLREIADHLQS